MHPAHHKKNEAVDPAFEKALNDYLEVALEREKSDYKSDIEPFDAYAKKLRARLSEGLHQFQKSYNSGYKVLVEEIKKQHKDIDLSPFEPNVKNLKLLDDPVAFIDFLSKGQVLRDLLGFSPEAMVSFYEAGAHLLETQRFREGLDAFFFLVTISPDVSEFWLDLGYAYSQLGEYQAAIEAYSRAIDIDPNSADGYLASAGTFVKMQDFEQAQRTCEIGLQHALAHRQEPWAEELGTMLEEAKRQIDTLFTKSQYGTFAS